MSKNQDRHADPDNAQIMVKEEGGLVGKSLPEVRPDQEMQIDDAIAGLMAAFIDKTDVCPPYWSKARDQFLREAVRQSDFAAGVMYTVGLRLENIPFTVIPRDYSIKRHVKLAKEYNQIWQLSWKKARSKFIQDILGQDNGGFLELLDHPSASTTPTNLPRTTFGGVRYIDAARCNRTSDPIFPVVVRWKDGDLYKLHFTRVLDMVQMPSGDDRLHGVGLSAMSRAIRNLSFLNDIAVLYSEFMGSRPLSQILFGAGMDAQQLRDIFLKADEKMDNEGLTRSSKMVFVGSDDNTAKLEGIRLKMLPEGFSKTSEVTLAVFAIAMAFGVDPREIWASTVTGATKADANIQHTKTKMKTILWFAETVKEEAEEKFLPPQLMMRIDSLADDDQDAQRAAIMSVQGETNKILLENEQVDVRQTRVWMLENEQISSADFRRIELADGRLPNGDDVLTLFFSEDERVTTLLDLGVADPLNIVANDAETIIDKINARRAVVIEALATASHQGERNAAQEAQAALDRLQELYEGQVEPEEPEIIEGQPPEEPIPEDETRSKAQAGDVLYEDGDVLITTGDVDLAFEEAGAVDPILEELLNAEQDA